MGVSSRVTNDNARCKLIKETRLCNIRPCSSMSIPVKVRNVFGAFKILIRGYITVLQPCSPATMLNRFRKGLLSRAQIGINITACIQPPSLNFSVPRALSGKFCLFMVLLLCGEHPSQDDDRVDVDHVPASSRSVHGCPTVN